MNQASLQSRHRRKEEEEEKDHHTLIPVGSRGRFRSYQIKIKKGKEKGTKEAEAKMTSTSGKKGEGGLYSSFYPLFFYDDYFYYFPGRQKPWMVGWLASGTGRGAFNRTEAFIFLIHST